MRSYKWLWQLLPITTIAVCAVFGANIVAQLISQEVFPERARAATVPRAVVAQSTRPIAVINSETLVSRNMFCSACSPAGEPLSSDVAIRSQLPLRLIATNVSTLPSQSSFASVVNLQDQRQGGYRVGENIPNAGLVEAIGRNYLDLTAFGSEARQRVYFDAKRMAARPSPRRVASARASLVDEYVRAISETHYQVDRDLIGKLRANPRLAGARALPIYKEGAMVGVRLSGVRTNGLAHGMGLRSGDKVLAANGVKLSSLEAGLELLGQLPTRDHWNIAIERRGKPVQLQVDLQ